MRNQAGSDWVTKAMVFTISTTLAGIGSGVLFGIVGGIISSTVRSALATLLALAAIVISVKELSGRPLNLFQCDFETPQSWVHKGPIIWAIQNGLALGCGFTSRIGFWLWYVVPLGAFLVGSPILGAIIFGVYGLVRGIMVWVLIHGLARKYQEDFAERLISYRRIAQLMTAGQLFSLGVATVIIIGF